jgi:flagellar hook assembly protein FlgD
VSSSAVPVRLLAPEEGGRAVYDLDVRVFDAGGRLVRTLFSGAAFPGSRDFLWDGRSDAGLAAVPGMYWVQVRTGRGDQESAPVTLLR